MPSFSAYDTLPFFDQTLHGLHFMLCAFAVLVGCVSLKTEKGSVEHKFFGLIYVPLSLLALLLASYMAWTETSIVLFCFTSFCTYLLLSGWRAVHEDDAPHLIDVAIPAALFLLALVVTLEVMTNDIGLRGFYVLFFAINAFYLSWRDAQHLRERFYWSRRKIYFADMYFGALRPSSWMGRHIAGMVGSMLANVSVIVLTLLPLSLHALWPASLILAGAGIAWRERQKKVRIKHALPPAFQKAPKSRPAKQDEPVIRRAA